MEKIKEYAHFKYGADIEYFNLGNASYNISYDNSTPEISFIGLPVAKVTDVQVNNFKEANAGVFVFNIFDNTLRTACEHIENQLSNNLDII